MNQTSGWWQLNDTDRNIDHGGGSTTESIQSDRYNRWYLTDKWPWTLNAKGSKNKTDLFTVTITCKGIQTTYHFHRFCASS